MEANDIELLELNLLLEAIFHRWGHDFRNYAVASIRRRVMQFMEKSGMKTISQLIPAVVHNPEVFQQLLSELSVTVTGMFRDPALFLALRHTVVPCLDSYPSVKIWHAGCATGEEAYSLAILLEEEGLDRKTTIYATDFNDTALEKAKTGIYEMDKAKIYARNYLAAGGKQAFSEYYQARYGAFALRKSLRQKITFANHNLAVDGVFSETHMILCRNVLIYFNPTLQERVLNLFYDGLVPHGFLCLGTKEGFHTPMFKGRFKCIDNKNRIYQKKNG